jgi:hypothetical protein
MISFVDQAIFIMHIYMSLFPLFKIYFVRFLSPRPAKTARLILTIFTSKDAVSRKEVPFWGPNASKNFQGVHFPPKPPKFGPGIGISSLTLRWAEKNIYK